MSGDEGERGLDDPEKGVTLARFRQKMLINPVDWDGVTFSSAPVNFICHTCDSQHMIKRKQCRWHRRKVNSDSLFNERFQIMMLQTLLLSLSFWVLFLLAINDRLYFYKRFMFLWATKHAPEYWSRDPFWVLVLSRGALMRPGKHGVYNPCACPEWFMNNHFCWNQFVSLDTFVYLLSSGDKVKN